MGEKHARHNERPLKLVYVIALKPTAIHRENDFEAADTAHTIVLLDAAEAYHHEN